MAVVVVDGKVVVVAVGRVSPMTSGGASGREKTRLVSRRGLKPKSHLDELGVR
jgi:hypothetical protein